MVFLLKLVIKTEFAKIPPSNYRKAKAKVLHVVSTGDQISLCDPVNPVLSVFPSQPDKNKKSPGFTGGFWVEDRARTDDPQNHNLVL